jgi:hypothetical protein
VANDDNEIIYLHVGGCGCNLGSSFWEEKRNSIDSTSFMQMNKKQVPRAIFIDSDSQLIGKLNKSDLNFKTVYYDAESPNGVAAK